MSKAEDGIRIAYACLHDPDDVHSWSGLVSGIAESLRTAGATVTAIGSRVRGHPLSYARKAAAQLLTRRRFLVDRDRTSLRSWARTINRRLARTEHDVVLCPTSSLVPFLETSRPIAFWTDATFGSMVGFYREFSRLSSGTIRRGHAIEADALRRCARAIYSSQWAADSAVAHYGADRSKLSVVPFGSNLGLELDAEELERRLPSRLSGTIRLLLVGVDWQRKGGPTATAAVAELRRRGIDAELHLVGCQPDEPAPAWTVRHGFISKHAPDGARRLSELFAQATALLLPTRADCVPVVLAEAMAHGLPCVVAGVGGVQTAVADDEDGMVLPPDCPPERYADAIAALIEHPERYADVARAALRRYRTSCSWPIAGHEVVRILRSLTPDPAIDGAGR